MAALATPVQLPFAPISANWSALPAWLPVADMGALPVNVFLLRGTEPMLVDTGVAFLADALLDRVAEQIDPTDLRWIWLSHTDADHVGGLEKILAAAPTARVVTNFLGAGKLALMGKVDPTRLHVLKPGEALEVGGHRLLQVRPPYYDAPETMGFIDAKERVLFAADAFGALLPEVVEALVDLPLSTLREGMVGWAAIDAPWLAQQNPRSLGAVLRGLEALDPTHVLSAHLPVASDIGRLTGIIHAAYGSPATATVGAEELAAVRAALAEAA